MSIFAKILCLLLVATVTSAGDEIDPNPLVDMVEKAVEPSLHLMQQACSSAKKATSLLLSEVKLDVPCVPEWKRKWHGVRRSMMYLFTAQHLKLFQEFAKTKRSFVMECSDYVLERASRLRDEVETYCSKNINNMQEKKDAIINKVLSKSLREQEEKGFVMEFKRDMKEMEQNLQTIAEEAKLDMHSKVYGTIVLRDEWILYVVPCVQRLMVQRPKSTAATTSL